MQRRRIFRPSPLPRLLAGAAVLVGVTATATGLFAVLPVALSGPSATRPVWRAEAAEVRVVDGATLRLGDRVLRLADVAAPGRGQRCDGTDCTTAATTTLAAMVAGRPVDCVIAGEDAHGRAFGQCRAGGIALDVALVGAGLAVTTASAGAELAAVEAGARQARRGVWAAR